jgi:hypothetical protein
MKIPVDVCLRGTDFATTKTFEGIIRHPSDWTDEDVRSLLEGMLRIMHMLKHDQPPEQAIALRGISWIVSPYDEGGVVVALEIGMGAAIAGPIDIDKTDLEAMIARVVVRPSSASVH